MSFQHVMDQSPGHFGWRLWHLDATGTQLLSPYHKGTLRGGGRIVESVCPHRRQPLQLSDTCDCGVYFDSNPAEAIERWHWGAADFGAEFIALTFGAAVGVAAPDPILPDTAMRTPRYAILAIVVIPGHSTAAQLRARYGVNVTMRDITEATLQGVHDAVRAELRHTPSAQFFEDLRTEPLLPDGGHVMDRLPHLFGWRVWRLDECGMLEDPRGEAQSAIRVRRNRAGGAYFESECAHEITDPRCMCGLVYVASGLYCSALLATWEQLYLDSGWEPDSFSFAATYGIANGRITKDSNPAFDIRRCRRYFPMTVCIPNGQQHRQSALRRHYGMAVIPALHPQTFTAVERAARTRLAHVGPEDLS